MKTENDLSKKIEEINELELTASVQTKKGRYYVVISYTDENGKSKPKWRATGLEAVPGNKKAAQKKIVNIINQFKEELIEIAKQEYQASIPKLEPQQLQIEYENIDSDVESENEETGLDMQRIQKCIFLYN